MKLYKFLLLTLFLVFGIDAFATSNYPTSHLEEEMESIGSLLDQDGLLHKQRKAQQQNTVKFNQKSFKNTKEQLFKASLEILRFAPLASADINGGVLVTEWYSPKDHSNTQLKITVYLINDKEAGATVEVLVFERHKTINGWSAYQESKGTAKMLKDKILDKARNLNLKSVK